MKSQKYLVNPEKATATTRNEKEKKMEQRTSDGTNQPKKKHDGRFKSNHH